MGEFGKKLRALRMARGMSQEEMAAFLGTSKQVISRYENNLRSPKISVAAEYARRLGVPLSALSDDSSDLSPLPPDTLPVQLARVPLLGDIACGEPIFAEEDYSTYMAVGASIDCDFALRCKGDSMIGARIYDGDIVFIRRTDVVEDGAIAAVLIDDDATLKRVYQLSDGRVELRAENPAFARIIIGGEGETRTFRVLGVAVAFQSAIR